VSRVYVSAKYVSCTGMLACVTGIVFVQVTYKECSRITDSKTNPIISADTIAAISTPPDFYGLPAGSMVSGVRMRISEPKRRYCW